MSSHQPKKFWIPNDALTDAEMGLDNSSRVESKRGQPWLIDSNAPELFSNKKQAMEAGNGRPVSGVSQAVSSWDNTSQFQSVPGQFTDRHFRSEPAQTINLGEGNTQSVGNGNINLGRKGFDNQYGNYSSVGLSMSYASEDPSSYISFGGIRKVKVNEVRESDNSVPASMGQSYPRGDNNTISMGINYNKSYDNTKLLGPTHNTGEENAISIGSSFSKADDNFISMGHTFSKGDGSFISMAHNYNKGGNSILSMGQSFDKEDGNFISMGQSYGKGDNSFISLGNSYNKGHENFISMGATYSKANDNFISMAPTYDKQAENVISLAQTYDNADSVVVPVVPPNDKGDSILSMGHQYNKNENTAISFESFQDGHETNPSGGMINTYDLLMSNQNTAQQPEESGLKDPVQSKMDPNVEGALKFDSKTDAVPKTKEPKSTRKAPTNNFPSNVKSLLSTGMFDGVPVKYVSWSREKNLKGIIKGTGYLCSCADCNHSKSLNAYEFERHAGAKTKHPNNHIYFANGKTIYAVVQELKHTPQDMLFDTIQTVTGSPINQKNFRNWKASFQAATRELQRIYGKDDAAASS